MARYAKDDVEPQVGELVSSMIKSIRQETTESEAVKALKGVTDNPQATVSCCYRGDRRLRQHLR
jgi:hypothetical protein